MSPPRNLSFLDNSVEAEQSIQTVEQAFGADWLACAGGKHRMQRVWQRRDPLATSELVCLSYALLAVRAMGESASRWLAKTIRRAKNEPANGHGLITEILTCGQLTVIGGSLELAQENQRGYDAIARHANGWTHYISIKNRDVSDKEKEFHQAGRRIRRAWQDRLRLDRCSGGLNVVSVVPLEAVQEQTIIQHIRTAPSVTRKWALLNDSVHITVVPPYAHLGPLNATRNSDHVIVVASQPPSEQARFKTELRKAAQQLGKNVVKAGKTCNVVHMRVHPSADLALLESAAQELLVQPDVEFDAVLFLQPSVVHENDQSRINHAFRFVMGSRYLDFMRNRGESKVPPYGYQFGIGSISMEPSRMVLSSAEGIVSELPPHAYIFQEGDYYLDTTPDGRGGYGATIGAVSSGITRHCVFAHQGREVVITPLVPEADILHLL